MNITRRERVLGFILAGVGGEHQHAPALETLDGFTLLRKCIVNGTVEPTPSNDPPVSFLISADTSDYADFPTLVAMRELPRVSPVLLCLPLALLPQKIHIGMNIAAVSSGQLECMACATICFAMHFGIHVDNSLFAITTLLNTAIRLVLSQSGSGPHSAYQLACNQRLDVIQFDGGVLSLMSTCLWALRELNRMLVRWEVDTDRQQLPDLRGFARRIIARVGSMSTDPLYTHCVAMTLACYIGNVHLSGNHNDMSPTTSQRVRRFLHAYLKYTN